MIENFELEGDAEEGATKKRKKRVKNHSVHQMSQALRNYKRERKNVEEDLLKTLTKVNLDKQILFQEK